MAYELAKAYVSVGVNMGALRSGLSAAGSMIKRALFSWQSMAAGAIGSIGGLGIGKWAVGLAADLEDATIAFNVIIKDMEKTRTLLAELNRFSIVTPYEPAEVIRAGQTLVQAGVGVNEVEDTLRVLGDLAAGAGGDINELVRGFVKLKGEGRLLAELEDIFLTQGILLRDLIMKYSDLKGEYRELRASGKITFEEVMKAFRRSTAEGGIFFQAMELRSKSFRGLWSTLKGDIDEFGKTIGAALVPQLKDVVRQMDELVKRITPIMGNMIKEWRTGLDILRMSFELFSMKAVDSFAIIGRASIALAKSVPEMVRVMFLASIENIKSLIRGTDPIAGFLMDQTLGVFSLIAKGTWTLTNIIIKQMDILVTSIRIAIDTMVTELTLLAKLMVGPLAPAMFVAFDSRLKTWRNAVKSNRDKNKVPTNMDEIWSDVFKPNPNIERLEKTLNEAMKRFLTPADKTDAAKKDKRAKEKGTMFGEDIFGGFRDKIAGLVTTLHTMEKASRQPWFMQKDQVDDNRQKQWGRSMGFDELNNTMQQAFLEQNPVEKTNELLFNHTKLFDKIERNTDRFNAAVNELAPKIGKAVAAAVTVVLPYIKAND